MQVFFLKVMHNLVKQTNLLNKNIDLFFFYYVPNFIDLFGLGAVFYAYI